MYKSKALGYLSNLNLKV